MKRRLIVLAAVLGIAWCVHAPLLRGLVSLLIVDQPANDANYLCLCAAPDGSADGEDAFREAARFYRENPAHRIVLVTPQPNRLVQIGALPSFEALARGELRKDGVPDEAVLVVAGTARDHWEEARLLGDWLAERGNPPAILLCDQLGSAGRRRVLDQVLGPGAAGVRIHSLPASCFDAEGWWKTRDGVKNVLFAYLAVGYIRFQGDDAGMPSYASPEAYENDFRKTIGEPRP